jgi:hypothetical protein
MYEMEGPRPGLVVKRYRFLGALFASASTKSRYRLKFRLPGSSGSEALPSRLRFPPCDPVPLSGSFSVVTTFYACRAGPTRVFCQYFQDSLGVHKVIHSSATVILRQGGVSTAVSTSGPRGQSLVGAGWQRIGTRAARRPAAVPEQSCRQATAADSGCAVVGVGGRPGLRNFEGAGRCQPLIVTGSCDYSQVRTIVARFVWRG